MTIADIMKQAQALSPEERKELAMLLIDTLDVTPESKPDAPKAHWGQSLVQMIESLDLSDWEAMDMDDPVEWVKQIRRENEDRLKP